MSKPEQILSTALSKALPSNKVQQSPARVSLTTNGPIFLSAKDLKGKK